MLVVALSVIHSRSVGDCDRGADDNFGCDGNDGLGGKHHHLLLRHHRHNFVLCWHCLSARSHRLADKDGLHKRRSFMPTVEYSQILLQASRLLAGHDEENQTVKQKPQTRDDAQSQHRHNAMSLRAFLLITCLHLRKVRDGHKAVWNQLPIIWP